MAIVKGPALSIEASGNLGAICYSTWRSLQIAKDVWTGTVPNTAKQVVMQGYMTAVSQHWGQTLTSDQRATWNRRAETIVWRGRLGSSYIPTGFQLFMKWNIRRKVMLLSIMNVAPVEQEWVEVNELLYTVAPTFPRVYLRLAIESLVDIKSYGAEYYKAGPYDSGGRRPIEGEWVFRILKVPPTMWYDASVILNKWYWYRARAVSEFGGVQNWFEIQVEIA